MAVRSLAVSGAFALVAWLLVALVSGGAGGAGRAERVGTRLVSFSPSDVVGVVVSRGDQQAGVELDASGVWVVEAGGSSWFAKPERVRAGLRLLSDLMVRSAGEGAVDDGVSVSISLRGGGSVDLRFGASGVGGLDRVGVGGGVFAVDAGVAAVFEPSAIGAWAEDTPFALMDPSVRRIAFGADDGRSFEMARTGDRWGLVGEENISVDAGRVESWVRSGGVMPAGAFWEKSDAVSGTVRVRVEAASGSAVSWWAAESAGDGSIVRAGLDSGREVGPWVCSRAFAFATEEDLIARRVWSEASSTVLGLRVPGQAATRTGETWDQPWASGVVALLTGTDASVVAYPAEGSGASVEVLGVGGRVLSTLLVDGEDDVLRVFRGGVCWSFDRADLTWAGVEGFDFLRGVPAGDEGME